MLLGVLLGVLSSLACGEGTSAAGLAPGSTAGASTGLGGAGSDKFPATEQSAMSPSGDEVLCEPQAPGVTRIAQQDGLEALRGCTRLGGRLELQPFEGMSLSPLASLVNIEGGLIIDSSVGSDGQPRAGSDSPLNLHGLENLQSVDSLQLSGLSIADLHALNGLDSVKSLRVTQCKGLTSLESLSGLVVQEDLYLASNPDLLDLKGISVEPQMTTVSVLDNPVLSELSSLSALRQVLFLELSGEAIENLRDLRSLRRVGISLELRQLQIVSLMPLNNLEHLAGLALTELPKLESLVGLPELPELGNLMIRHTGLVQLDALYSYRQLGVIQIENNPQLISLAGLSAAEQMTRLSIQGNPLLQQIAAMPGIEQLESLLIVGNESLLAAPVFENLQTVETDLFIQRNDSLQEVLGFEQLRSVDALRISANQVLEQLKFGSLRSVFYLDLSCNPLLPREPLTAVAEQSRPQTVAFDGTLGEEQSCQPKP